MSSNDTYTYILREELTWAKARIAELEAQLVAQQSSFEASQGRAADTIDKLEAQLEKLSGKTGYCEQCERLGRENRELREALQEAASVIRSINAGKGDRILVDGEPMYRQTEEWVRWAIDEILPVVDKALSGGG
jgi:chromosome segregation ATPase